MTSSSATELLNGTQRIYSDYNSEGGTTWIQSPVSRQVFEQGNHQIVDGIYVQVKPFELVLPASESLMQEFTAWDAASDEALNKFESENL